MTGQNRKKNLSECQVVILAGGLGTRLGELTDKTPKPLVSVNGRPYLHWQLSDLKRQGVKRILLLCAHMGEQIRAHFGDGGSLGLEIQYSFEPSPLGTGGALKLAEAKLDPIFILMNGDSYCSLPLAEMWADYLRMAPAFDALVSAFLDLDDTPVPPNLDVHPSTKLVNRYKKNGGTAAGFNAVDSGVYILNRDILKSAGKFQLEDLWPNLIAQRKLGAHIDNTKFYDIGTPERLKIFEDMIRDHF